MVIVTHNATLAPAADRVIRMKNGRVQEQALNPAPLSVEEVGW